MKNRTSMGQWKAKLIRKKGRGSQATGKSKGIVADALAKYMCRRNRSYKHPLYNVVMSKIGLKRQKG